MKKFVPLLVLTASAAWGSTGIVTRYISNYGFSVIQISAIKILSAAIALFLFLLLTDRQKLKIKRKDIKWFLACAVFSLIINMTAYNATVQLASLSTAVVLLYTSPIFVMILSVILFKEKLTFRKVTALVLAFSGCFLTVGFSAGSTISNLPLVLGTGLAAGFSFGLFSILGKFLVGSYTPLTIAAYMFLFAAAIMIWFANPAEMAGKIADIPSRLPLFILGSIISQGLPYVCYSTALQYMESSKASIMLSFEVVMASLYGVLFYGESLSLFNILGIICIVSAILFLELKIRGQIAQNG